jgi:hypothetical protein
MAVRVAESMIFLRIVTFPCCCPLIADDAVILRI